ncbi:MAG: hypothetical protein ABIC04_04090 [Nanoarchaeota archaeon]
MSDVLVSVRMPESLLSKLKELAEKEHYMDVSEKIRSITRKNWLKSMYPELAEVARLRKDIMDEIRKKSEKEVTKKVVSELNEIKNQLKIEASK